MTPSFRSRRRNVAALALTIATLCGALWFSPASVRDTALDRALPGSGPAGTGAGTDNEDPESPATASTPPSESSTADGGPGADATRAKPADGPVVGPVAGPIAVPIGATGGSAPYVPGVSAPSGSAGSSNPPSAPTAGGGADGGGGGDEGVSMGSDGAGPEAGPSPSPSPSVEGCWSFRWQQDAQAVYRRNLSDPYGLDGARGPFNGDGLACTHLAVDPSRKRSTPVGAYEPPAPQIPIKSELVAPASTKYFGVTQDGIPGDTGLLDRLSDQVGKAPSMLQWFATWDEPYRPAKVQAAWERGALPVITWMPGHKGNRNPSDISLQKIVDGDWDDYILRYAGDVAREGKPVVLRFAHEANGNWYPWSAGGNRKLERGDDGEEPFFNTPALYREAWRHVWTLFDQVGANDDVIWAYSPVRSDTIQPNNTDRSRITYGMTSIADGYPGDAYVDWVGLSAYAYSGTAWSYADTFAKSVDEYAVIAPDKRILVAETGAWEDTGPVSNTERKAAWITDTLTHVAADPRFVGFAWFNNVAVDVHTVDGVLVSTDNTWDSSPLSLAAFTAAVADPVWATGVAPDTLGTTGSRTTRTSRTSRTSHSTPSPTGGNR